MKKSTKKIAAGIATGRLRFEEQGAPQTGVEAAKKFIAAEKRGPHMWSVLSTRPFKCEGAGTERDITTALVGERT